MTADQTIALQLKEYLVVCLAKAIDTAMIAQNGTDWFSGFAQEEQAADVRFSILPTVCSSVYDLDMQALFKFLRYRENYTDIVLQYYQFITDEDNHENHAKKARFIRLMTRLITDFRNCMEAHVPAYAIESTRSDSLYGYADAITDMLKLAEIFHSVCDDRGVSYFDTMKKLVADHETQKKTKSYPISNVITALNHSVSAAELLHCCETIGIPIITDDGVLCITSVDYATDLSRIRAHFALAKATRSNKKQRRLIIAAVTIGVVALIVGVITFIATRPPAPEDNYHRYDSVATVRKSETPALHPLYVYWDDDDLVMECQIFNGTGNTIRNIDVMNFSVSNDNGIIAKSSFDNIENGISLADEQQSTVVFRFESTCVNMPGADLTGTLTFHCEDIQYVPETGT